MEDKDKLFLIVYFGVKSVKDMLYSNQIMSGFYQRIKNTLDDTVKVFIVPQRTTDEIKFEILNTENISEEKIQKLIDTYENVLKISDIKLK